MQLVQIGIVESLFKDPSDPFDMREQASQIVIHDDFVPGLSRLEEHKYIQVLFGLHLSERFDLITRNKAGDEKGVFASRTPHRPSSMGTTTVKLLKVDRNRLYVRGLDAVDGSPVYDIKPFVPTLDTDALEVELIDHLNQNPRRDITHAIRSSNAARCLIKTAEIHGHFCPGSALGVMASLAGLTHPVIGSVISEGMEDVIAIVEVNACFADGVQVVSGCTLGNNSLIYRDLGRHAVTFAKRGQEQAVRVHVRPGFRSVVSSQVPEFFPLMEKVIKERAGTVEDEADFKNAGKKAAFALVQCPFEQILEIQVVRSSLPPYAPITPTVICSKCGEEMMSTKAVRLETGSYLCRICSRQSYPQVEGQGIVMNNGIADMKA